MKVSRLSYSHFVTSKDVQVVSLEFQVHGLAFDILKGTGRTHRQKPERAAIDLMKEIRTQVLTDLYNSVAMAGANFSDPYLFRPDAQLNGAVFLPSAGLHRCTPIKHQRSVLRFISSVSSYTNRFRPIHKIRKLVVLTAFMAESRL